MTRSVALALLLALAGPAAAADPLPVAPPPREVRADGSRDPAPEAAKAEDPAEVVNRIIANAKRASDKLAMTDAGEGTRATQATVLKDIDALLNPPDSPPKGGDSNDMSKQDGKDNKNKQDGKDNNPKDQKADGKGNDGMPKQPDGMGNKGGMEPKGGMNPGGMEPKGGMNQSGMGQPKDGQANGRRPRAGGEPKDGKEPGGTASAGGKQPMPADPGAAAAKAGTPKDPPATAAGGVDGKTDRPPPPVQPQVPLADEVAKEVWGHLPERLRQQMSQYYREEFMPRYSGLLKQYYSSLSNTPPAAPR